MSVAGASYVIFVDDEMLAAPVEEGDSRYFVDHIVPNLRPLTEEEYLNGPAVMLHTAARSSYILFRGEVYWCTEWEPGLIVVRFSPDGRLAWTALRSPVPEFGGREAVAEDVLAYDEDAENHLYNLVFNAWDAQFDEDDRKDRGFLPADDVSASAYRAALAHVDQLGAQVPARDAGEALFREWTTRCKDNLQEWAGEGVRVPSE